MAKKSTKTTETKEIKANWSEMSVKDLKLELQKIVLNVRSGKEKNTSLVRKLKREIAKKLSSNIKN